MPKNTLFMKSLFEEVIADCERYNLSYEDPHFPASGCSLSLYKTLPVQKVKWKRLKEFIKQENVTSDNLCFIGQDSLVSFRKGQFGTSEFIGALAIISQFPELYDNIINLHPKKFARSISKCYDYGVFQFKFWYNGTLQKVFIDDRLPVDEREELLFVSSGKHNFLPSLLEKAYAKLLGCYEHIGHCTLPEILHHLTGGVVESYDVNLCPRSTQHLANAFFRALESRSPIGCMIDISKDGQGVRLSNGLISCHQYIVNDIREIKLVTEKGEIPLTLVRLKNPWGMREPWRGSWNVQSPEWKRLSADDRDQMGLYLDSEAEFWMDIREFVRLFDVIEICNMPSSLERRRSSTSLATAAAPPPVAAEWHSNLFHGRWKNGSSAGGRPFCTDTHWTNPQYRFEVKEDVQDGGRPCMTIVELEQKVEFMPEEEEKKTIGFVVYKCPALAPFPLPKSFFEENTFVARCDFFCNQRFVVRRFADLKAGTYVVVPSTYQAELDGSFILRILTSVSCDALSSEEIPKSVPLAGRSSTGSQGVESTRDPKEEAIERHFLELASGDQQINLQEMRLILNKDLKLENQAKDFSLELCKHLISLIDKNSKTHVDLHEMLYLWNVVKSWRKAFVAHDKSKQGWVNSKELKSIITSMGYKFTPLVLNQLTYRYSNEQHSIELESFITCMARILNLHEIFKKREKNDKITCTLDEWLELSLSIL